MRAWLLLLLLVPAAAAETHVVQTVATGDSSAPFAFSPASLVIEVGDTVRWVNSDGAFHTTTSQDGVWTGNLAKQNDTYEHTFDEAGTFAYRCNPHAGFMTASITVQGSTDGGGDAMDNGEETVPGIYWPFVAVAVLGIMRLRR